MMRRFGFVFLMSCLLMWGQIVVAQSLPDQIRISLEKATQEKPNLLDGIPLKKTETVFQFYALNGFEPQWSSGGILAEQAYELRFEIQQAKYDGLRPADYHLSYLSGFLESFDQRKKANESIESSELAKIDILLTDAFFELAEDLEWGRINPALLRTPWSIPRKSLKEDHGKLLLESLHAKSIRSGLAKLYPKTPIYRKGKQLIRELEDQDKSLSIDWKPIKTDRSFKVGDSNPLIVQVRERLAFWGYSSVGLPQDSKFFDSLLWKEVVRFQMEKGLAGDGVLGRLTLAALNESPDLLIDKIKVNLERLRWIPAHFFEEEAILVNIPSFQLVYHSGSDTLFTTKVIVGTLKHQSPVFTASMSYLVMSPYWNIPSSIARNETLPAIRKNPGYLERNHMEVVTAAGNPVPKSQINWNSRPFPYLIRQKPGPDNALGLVKFMFPNPYNVYLHDTPAKQLFDREVRTFSHGCIRMQHPRAFAELLLKNMPEWTTERIWEAMNQSKEQIVYLDKKIPVAVIYLTFVTDFKGYPIFRQDVYNRDLEVLTLLNR